MHAVDKAVVDLDGKAQRLAAALPDVFAPGDAGDGVVLVKIPLVRAAGKVEPRQAGEVDEVIGLRGGLEKRGLPLAFLLRRAAEGGKRRILGNGEDPELLAALFQLRKARRACREQIHLAAAESIAQVFCLVDGLRDEPDHGMIK